MPGFTPPVRIFGAAAAARTASIRSAEPSIGIS
jgi:hypothetical protein